MNQYILKNKNTIIYVSIFLSYISLLIGFFLNEDLAGGAAQDFNFYISVLNTFNNDFTNSFLNYKAFDSDHSPFFVSFLTLINIFEKLNFLPISNNIDNKYQNIINYGFKYDFLRFVFLHICLLVPFIFYKSLKLIFKGCDNVYLILLSLIILYSPYFRAYAIWAGETNLGLIFLILSTYFFLNIDKTYSAKERKLYIFLNVLFFALSAYSRPIYSLISIYFFYKIFLKYSFRAETILFILFNILLSSPALYYFIILDNYSFTQYINFFYNPTLTLYSTNIILSSSIIFFYLIPFIINNYNLFAKEILLLNRKNFIYFLLATSLGSFLIYNFNYSIEMNGGGVFYILSNKIFNNNYILYPVSIFSLYAIFSIILKKNLNDLLLIILIFCFDPDPWIYHKSFDPILYCLFFTLFNNNIFKNLNRYNQFFYTRNIVIFFITFFGMLLIYRNFI